MSAGTGRAALSADIDVPVTAWDEVTASSAVPTGETPAASAATPESAAIAGPNRNPVAPAASTEAPGEQSLQSLNTVDQLSGSPAAAYTRREVGGGSGTASAVASATGGLGAPFLGLFGNGTADHPDGGIIWGNGFSWVASTCTGTTACNGGSAGWFGTGGEGGAGVDGGVGTQGPRAGGNGGRGGLFFGNGGAGGDGASALTAGNFGGNGGTGGSAGSIGRAHV